MVMFVWLLFVPDLMCAHYSVLTRQLGVIHPHVGQDRNKMLMFTQQKVGVHWSHY